MPWCKVDEGGKPIGDKTRIKQHDDQTFFKNDDPLLLEYEKSYKNQIKEKDKNEALVFEKVREIAIKELKKENKLDENYK